MVYRKGVLKFVWYNWWIDLVFEMVGNKGYLKLECEIDWWNDLKKWLVERVGTFLTIEWVGRNDWQNWLMEMVPTIGLYKGLVEFGSRND